MGVADGCGVGDGDGEALRVGVGVDDGAGVGVGLRWAGVGVRPTVSVLVMARVSLLGQVERVVAVYCDASPNVVVVGRADRIAPLCGRTFQLGVRLPLHLVREP